MSKECGCVEMKILQVFKQNCNSNKEVEMTCSKIAKEIGYKKSGGILSYAIQLLAMKGYIEVLGKGRYRVLNEHTS